MSLIAKSMLAVFAACCALQTGCVRRTITITSTPPGALVWVNDREIGRTPVDVEFLYYGEYDVRLELDGYEPRMTRGRADAPIWEIPPIDLAAEIVPVELHSRTHWHYELQPRDDDPDALLERARSLRWRMEGE